MHNGSPRRRRERERDRKLIKEIVTKNFPWLGKDMDIQVHKAQKSPIRFNSKKISLKYTIIKLSKIKVKERILKSAREKKLITYSNKAISRFLSITLQIGREGEYIQGVE